MSALGLERIPRTPAIEINGRHAIVSATMFAALRMRACYLGAGQWLVSIAGGSTTDGAPPVIRVPTLDAIAADRGRLPGLPLGLLIDLRRQLDYLRADVKAEISRRLIPSDAHEPADDDALLTPQQAAERLALPVTWLYRHSRTLPFARRLSRKKLRFDRRGLERWQAAKRPGA
jgi:hypothetical protein